VEREYKVAKPLVFQFDGGEISFTLTKIDRSKLYGYKEVEVLDDQDRKCELATLADDGRTVVGRGGTGIGYVSADGNWCDKSQLRPVDLEGAEIEPVPSSYAAPIPLTETAGIPDYLEHNIRLAYLLQTEDDVTALANELTQGKLFKFPYSYRGGLEADAGFLLKGEAGDIFLAVGNPTKVEMIGLQQVAAVAEEEGEGDETDLMDFDMI
jgi:hypothetical protein